MTIIHNDHGVTVNTTIILQVANFDNIYHFALRDNERGRAPIDSPYMAKSSALLSERSVST